MPGPSSPLSLHALTESVDSGQIDTVLVVFTDMQGRLQGKRIHARYFLDEVAGHGMEGCNYLLAVDVEMNTVSGYEISSWEQGYGDFLITPDLGTLRLAPWLPTSAMVQCDLSWLDGTPVRQSPRQVLRAQADEAQRLGFTAYGATELEFIVFADSFQQAFDANYQGLTGSTRYNVDYSILGTSGDEPLMRDIRNAMYGAGLTVESSKGECNLGQHEIAFKYDQVLRTADNHVVFKAAAKELADRHGKALTFMAKYDEREGNSCHLHMSLRGTDGSIVFADGSGEGGGHGPENRSPVFGSFVAGVLATLQDFTLLYAPAINSYKRYQPGSFAPDGRRVGRGQPDLRAAGGRARQRPARGEPGARRRRQPLPRPGGDARRWPARRPQRAGARTGLRRQRLRRRLRAGAGHAARGPRPVRRVRGGGGRVRQGRRGALPAGRGGRAGGVRGGRDGLGAPAGVRAVLIGHVT